jgi:hypothetical protein
VLKIQTKRWLGLNKFKPKRQMGLQVQVFGLKKSKPKASIHRAIICSYGSKSYRNLILNKSKQKHRKKVNKIVLRILTNHRLGLNKFRPKRQKVL